MGKDPRIESIHQQIWKFINSEYDVRAPASEKGDELDSVISGLNILGEKLHENQKRSKDTEKRIDSLVRLLLRYTVLDFSERAVISENRDEIDAIAAGLNALGEEIRYSMDEQKRFKDELQRKARQLEVTNQELEAFSYSVSHDLRAPLRAIHGYSQMLLEEFDDKLNDEGNRRLHAVMQNARKMGNLIDELLNFSKLGRMELNKTELNPNELVKTVLTQLGAAGKDLAEINIRPMPLMSADYSMMFQVYQNLIENALKFSAGKEQPRIEIGAIDTDEGKTYYVRDNGAGFEMAYKHKLFGVFQRLHSEEEFEGTGVGLAIAQRIIRSHGGEIWGEGTVNKGATFYFTVGTKKLETDE